MRHQGALNGHLAFKHGTVTPKAKTLSELRGLVEDLGNRLSDIETEDLTKGRPVRHCPHCDNFPIKANTRRGELRLFNTHIKKRHPKEPLQASGVVVTITDVARSK